MNIETGYRLAVIILLVTFLSSCSNRIVDFAVRNVETSTAPALVNFENLSDPGESYHWDFGDGHTSIDSSPSHTYYLSGHYHVILESKKGNKVKKHTKEIIVKAPKKCLVLLETPLGNMLIELFDSTPKHRDNFLKLAENGYFDGLIFHRVIKDFMIQGGDPNSKNAPAGASLGSGGPGYQIDAEFDTELAHVKGALSAARTSDAVNPEKKSSGSQFYIVQGKAVDANNLKIMGQRMGIHYPDSIVKKYIELGGTPFLDQQYTVFGQVIEGLDVIDKIAEVQTGPQDRPVEDVKMSVKVIK